MSNIELAQILYALKVVFGTKVANKIFNKLLEHIQL